MALLNTHATVKKFVHFGLSEDQAEAITEAINEQNQELATKADINILKSEMKLVETKLEGKIDNLEVKLAGDIRSLGTDIKWIMAVLLAITGMLAKLTFFNT